jgi:putative endonuclease
MPFHVYIIYSKAIDQYYIGQSEDIDERLFRHKNSGSRSTKKVSDWELKYVEAFETRSNAVRRETEIKKKKSRKYIEWLINSVR